MEREWKGEWGVPSSNIITNDGVRHSETVVDRDNVSDTISRIQDDTGGSTRGVKG